MNSFSLNESYVETTARKGGILLHPTSFPGKFGIGDLGLNAYKFIDFLFKYKQNLWQILPLGPTGYGNSPYQCFSAFAGNPLLISPDKLKSLRLLTEKECTPQDTYLESNVDYGKVIPYKWELLELAFNRFLEEKPMNLMNNFKKFIIRHSFWLDEYCLFMSIKKANNLKAWFEWEDELKFRDESTLARWKKDHHNEIKFSKFCQFIFFLQWKELKTYANGKNIQIIGDIPIFVAYDSVDVWANSEYYYLDENKELLFVAGVPPDYFSSTGQRWGNPLYKWDLMKKNNYQWWAQRINHNLEQVNILRIDHFRGFESYWQIPNEEETAIVGKWMTGPGLDFFRTIEKQSGRLPIIAEDLGLITSQVEKLLQQTGFPGMRVLQFAFSGIEKPTSNDLDTVVVDPHHLPYNFHPNTVVYTGTHDNQTTKDWFRGLSKQVQKYILDYCNSNGEDVVGDLIRLAWSSVANYAIIPLQDILRLGDDARMNYPGKIGHNWEWRFTWNQLTKEKGLELKKLSRLYERF